jgi:hypothetical protein
LNMAGNTDKKFVCFSCVGEDFLSSHIKTHGIKGVCSYCGKHKKVLDLDTIAEMIEEGFYHFYYDPDGETSADDSLWEDCGLFLESPGLDTFDLLEEHLPEVSYDSTCSKTSPFSDLLGLLPDHKWQHNSFGAQCDISQDLFAWKYFVDHIKHQRRYFFTQDKAYPGTGYERIHGILDRMFGILEKFDMIKTLEPGTRVFRARSLEEGELYNEKTLGAPSPEHCTTSNRFSPAGIPMFYGAADPETCMAETGMAKNIVVGTWETIQPIKVWDLTKHGEFLHKGCVYTCGTEPSIFDTSRRDDCAGYRLVLQWATDLSLPVKRDGRENIEFVPRQVVVEYLCQKRPDVLGIITYSAKPRDNGVNYTFFVHSLAAKGKRLLRLLSADPYPSCQCLLCKHSCPRSNVPVLRAIQAIISVRMPGTKPPGTRRSRA